MDTSHGIEALKKRKIVDRIAKKVAFSKFVSKMVTKNSVGGSDEKSSSTWKCCVISFKSLKDLNKHVSGSHMLEILKIRDDIIEHGDDDVRYAPLKKKKIFHTSIVNEHQCPSTTLPEVFSSEDKYPWLPQTLMEDDIDIKQGRILLFYHYRNISIPKHVRAWQEELCQRLNLTGKVRVAPEGLNVTVGGTIKSTELYKESVLKHPLFNNLTDEDFKSSIGSSKDFPDGLKVCIYKEAVPMGIDPDKLSFREAGKHLNPDEFHEAVQSYKDDHLNETKNPSVFIDCRNFYESKIGRFDGAICPDIRKFSYWPEYVDTNKELFQDKNVYMYCTGGIRCERGSAYLKSKGICKEVYQLEGGIHKYIEKYPDGFFKGKLFVFDNRYHIAANKEILAECTYCNKPWDQYQPCTSSHCHQLVLSCNNCRDTQLTACCKTCQENNGKKGQLHREECECTQARVRIPLDTVVEKDVKKEPSELLNLHSSVSAK